MNIIVCIKQVPASNKIDIDEKTGTIKRLGAESKINPYDLFAVETALRIKEKVGGKVIAVTMGPPQTEDMMKDVYSMGVDDAVILSDKKFAGADVLATSFTISQGIRSMGAYDLIICGKQTTDGDTAQIGPELAEHLNIPHTAWVNELVAVSDEKIRVRQNLASVTQVSEMNYPCLITVDKDIVVPRLPSYRLKKKYEAKPVKILSLKDFDNKDLSRYGLVGSPTNVERVFAPDIVKKYEVLSGSSYDKSQSIITVLKKEKFVE